MNRAEILEAARVCVCGEREDDYGSPEDSFALIAKLWSAYTGETFGGKDVAMMMALLKVARIKAGNKTDSFVDLAGYAACAGEIAANELRGKEGLNKMDDDRTYIVTEFCPHCESEIEMRWDTDQLGYKAFCPVCGNRLMLCDECRHSGPDGGPIGPCDYDSNTDTCRFNRSERSAT